MISDAGLVEQCLEGDQEAYAELVRRHQDAVFNLAMSMTRYNRAEASDITQEAFIRAYRKLRGYKPQYAFRNWVMTISANLAKNRFRGTARRRQAEASYLEKNPGRTYHSDPRHLAVGDALTQLREAYRTPLTLRHMEGLSYQEIAHILGIGVSAAKMRVKRGTDELKRMLKPGTEAAAP